MWTRFSMVTMGRANGAENMQLPAIHAASNAPSMRCRCGSNSLSTASLSAPQKGSPHRSVVAEIVQVAPAVVLWWHVIGMLNQHHERESRFVHIHPIAAHQRAIEREYQAVRTVSLPYRQGNIPRPTSGPPLGLPLRLPAAPPAPQPVLLERELCLAMVWAEDAATKRAPTDFGQAVAGTHLGHQCRRGCRLSTISLY